MIKRIIILPGKVFSFVADFIIAKKEEFRVHRLYLKYRRDESVTKGRFEKAWYIVERIQEGTDDLDVESHRFISEENILVSEVFGINSIMFKQYRESKLKQKK